MLERLFHRIINSWMRRHSGFFAFSLSVISLSMVCLPPYLTRSAVQLQTPLPSIISHRGAAGLAPENTLASIQLALDAGAAYIEIDIHRTKDGELIIMHDHKVDRTTDGKGEIAELTWVEINQLRIKMPKIKAATSALVGAVDSSLSTKVPRLTDALRLVKDQAVELVIEVKKPERYPGIGQELVETLLAEDMLENVRVISFSTDWIDQLKERTPSLRTGHLYVFPPKQVSTTDLISIYSLSVSYLPRRIQRLRSEGKTVWIWTVNSKRKALRLAKKGVDGIVTDYPNLWK